MNIYMMFAGIIGGLLALAFILRYLLLDQLHRFKAEIAEQVSSKHSEQQTHHMQSQKILQDTLRETLTHHSQVLTASVENLTKTAESKLQQVNQVVEQRLNEGFAKTTE